MRKGYFQRILATIGYFILNLSIVLSSILLHFFGQVLLPSVLTCLMYLISSRFWTKTLTSGLPSHEVLTNLPLASLFY